MVFFDEKVTVRLRGFERQLLDFAVKKGSGRYDDVSHYCRVAIIEKLRKDFPEEFSLKGGV